jgi:hypothetical protein
VAEWLVSKPHWMMDLLRLPLTGATDMAMGMKHHSRLGFTMISWEFITTIARNLIQITNG